MDQATTLTEIIRIIPALLWVALGGIVVKLFYKPIRDDLLPKISGFRGLGVEFSFVRDSMERSLALAKKSEQWKVEVSSEDEERVLRRAREHEHIFRGAQMLWVDDRPQNNVNERRMFQQLNVRIDIAQSTDEALRMLGENSYDVVLSDMDRSDDPAAGLGLLKKHPADRPLPPVIFYIGVLNPERGVPGGAFGITNRPDELLHLTLDALERQKY